MKVLVSLVTGLALLGVQSARADDDVDSRTPAQCASSFAPRLKEAREAIKERDAYMAEYNRAMPWFYEHCRLLSPIEITARKLDDPNSFVCDTQAARPRELTTKFVATHSAPATVTDFQDRIHEDELCAESDPISLDMHDMSVDADSTRTEKLRSLSHSIDVECFKVTSPVCAKMRAELASIVAADRAEKSGK